MEARSKRAWRRTPGGGGCPGGRARRVVGALVALVLSAVLSPVAAPAAQGQDASTAVGDADGRDPRLHRVTMA